MIYTIPNPLGNNPKYLKLRPIIHNSDNKTINLKSFDLPPRAKKNTKCSKVSGQLKEVNTVGLTYTRKI